MNPTAFDPTQLKGLGIKPVASLLAHWRVALWVMCIVLIIAIPIVWVKGKAKYVTTSTVQIAPRYMKNIKDDNELDFQSNSQYRQFVEQQVRSVGRYDIVGKALKKLGSKADFLKQPKESERRTIERLQERLVILPVSDTYLMQVSLASESKEGIAELINMIVETYLAQMKEEQMYGSDERMKNLDIRIKELLTQSAAKTKRKMEIAQELGVSTFNDGDGNPYDKLLLGTRSALAEARNIRLAADAKLAAFMNAGETDITTRSINESVLTDPGLNSLKASLNNRRAALLSTISGLSQDHPAHVAARQELIEIEAAIMQQTGTLVREVNKSLLSRYQMTQDQAQRYELSLEDILVNQEKSSARFAVLFNEALNLSNEITQLNKETEDFRQRLNFFAAERGSLGFVRLVTPALPPEIPYGMGRKKLAFFAILAAIFAGLSVPILIDLLDRRIRTVNEVERTLGFPSLGWIIEQDNLAATMFSQDQIRRIAGGLIREKTNNATQVFSLCGVKPGAGSTKHCIELAKTLNALGYRTLVVEANAFRPDSRFISDKPGLKQCLSGQSDPMQCIVAASEDMPDHIGVGSLAGDVHLDRLDRLSETINLCAPHYQFILVDMPPLLLSADAEIMLNHLGQILLVVEAGAISRGELSRAARILDKTVSQAAGVIVNRVKTVERGGYIHELLVEFLTQRKFSDFESQSDWRLQTQKLQWPILEKMNQQYKRLLQPLIQRLRPPMSKEKK